MTTKLYVSSSTESNKVKANIQTTTRQVVWCLNGCSKFLLERGQETTCPLCGYIVKG